MTAELQSDRSVVRRCLQSFGWLLSFGAIALRLAAAEPTPAAAGNAELVEASGIVELGRAEGGWSPLRVGGLLHPGEQLRTGADSRAILRLSDLSLVRVRENTVLELRQPTGTAGRRSLFLRAGSVFFLNRDRPSSIEFDTPLASGAIRGTEFLLRAEAGTGATWLSLFDGAVDLKTPSEFFSLSRGQQIEVQPGKPAVITFALPARQLIQWVFYYPVVVFPPDLHWDPSEVDPFRATLAAYQSGDWREALDQLPPRAATESSGATVYRAQLQLAAGNVTVARDLLRTLPDAAPGVQALQQLIAAVTLEPESLADALPHFALASDAMGYSYRAQSRFDLAGAREAAREATRLAPSWGAAWERLAELEFTFDQRKEARQALARARELSPRFAPAFSLEGYIALANERPKEALDWFQQAVARDGALAPAWLGRGLAEAQMEQFEEARRSIQVAAVIEPQRAVFRSYLGKAFGQTGEDRLARKDFRLAQELDPADPTSWFYSALHEEQLNRNNQAVRELERSIALNTNHAVFRSRWLLDQDLAMRSADLAVVYDAAGLPEVGALAAQNAVAADYANFSGHLFAARGLSSRADPEGFNLRFETASESELLLANLLAPPGGGNLSRWVSQQSRLAYFTPRAFGVSTFTGFASSGNWEQDAAFYGRAAGFSYDVDVQYLSLAGQQPNGAREEIGASVQLQQRLTDSDTLYFSGGGSRDQRGDVASYYDPELQANRRLQVVETQEPNLYAGWHHEWSAQSHTLALVSYQRDLLDLQHADPNMFFLFHRDGEIVGIRSAPGLDLDLQSQFDFGSVELQQIWSTEVHQVVAGMRYQGGQVDSSTVLHQPLDHLLADEAATGDLNRASAYAYYQWTPRAWVRLNVGLSYDWLRYPANLEMPPLDPSPETQSQWSPKAALTFFPWDGGQLRGVYSKSLGGLYYDSSVSLEPGTLAGFTQAFRSLIPESVVGLVPGTSFQIGGVGFDQSLKSGTYFGVEAQQLKSEGTREVGALTNSGFGPVADELISLEESLDFRERTVSFYVNQLLGESWNIGVRGSLSEAQLNSQFPGIPANTPGLEQIDRDQSAVLGMLQFSLLYQHSCGWFAEWFSNYYHQDNQGYTPSLPGDAFWQQNFMTGYRWPRQRFEVRFGVLNLTDQNYHLNPLNLLNQPRRSRTFVTSLQLNF